MKERLISRIGRIISGSFNSIIDQIESAAPETVMAEAIREIDAAIDDVRAELGRTIAAKHMANSRLMAENKDHEALSDKIELALEKGREDLAEAAVARQLDIEAQIPVLEATIKDCGDQEKELEGYVQALLAKKRQMQEALRDYRQSRADAKVAGQAGDVAAASASDADVDHRVRSAESAFNRIMEKATGLPAGADVGERQTAVRLAELETMAHKNRIQERLAAIKNKRETD
ncbi:Suppressor of sigma54-dependent transcription [Desulfosarcina cetonica]|uniref:PspA/IM30 family protein n=1 Tax=Desulfosarcina cetonica TaxID=90730 RepID=UPI0006D0566F|nr:PspA/IM30 family protein [Desulfosarcina cetonica]VTR68725.1 Suppressor of sigma54-dependent transcription [Desulfosarcina cetonica]